MFTRRDFIKTIGLLGVFIFEPFGKIIRKINPGFNLVTEAGGELYEGFLLLEENASIPYFVKQTPYPIIGDVEKGDENKQSVLMYRGITQPIENIESIKEDINFNLFIFALLPPKMIFKHGHIIRFSGTREIWEVRIDYGFENDTESIVSITAHPIFPKPFPVWPDIAYPKKDLDEVILDSEFYWKKPEKIDYTPEPGIMKTTDDVLMFQWFSNDIQYTTSVVLKGWIDTPENIAKALVQI